VVLAHSGIHAAGAANANQSNEVSSLQCKVAFLMRRALGIKHGRGAR
jgi:hypothetical protein